MNVVGVNSSEIKSFSTTINILTILGPLQQIQGEKLAHAQFGHAAYETMAELGHWQLLKITHSTCEILLLWGFQNE